MSIGMGLVRANGCITTVTTIMMLMMVPEIAMMAKEASVGNMKIWLATLQ
jgi:hypothetical protein